MTEIASSEISGRTRRWDTGQLAWGVLLIAFAGFCVLCVITGVGVNYFLFQSTVPMQTIVRVGRGTVTWSDATLIPQATSSEIELFNSAMVRTDTVSQATLFVYDQYHDQLVATVTLKNDTSVDVRQVARPRFDFSTQGYLIELEDTTGELDVHVPTAVQRDVMLVINTRQNAVARFTRPGDYTIRANDNQLLVNNYSGDARVAIGENPNYAVPAGDRGILDLAASSYSMQPLSRLNLLGSGTFDASNVISVNGGATPGERAWGCNNQQNDMPSGFFALTQMDGLDVLRLGRGGGAASHGESFCSQYLVGGSGQQGYDISGYSYLGIRATFKIAGHSLSVCGSDGSECPLMLRMEYVPQNGSATTWYHGFFTRILAGFDSYPLTCDSCMLPHDIVNENGWYTYDSGNLLPLFQPGQRPVSLLNFRFYASGHEYDVYISDMALIVGQANATPVG
ncbi:MAG: hypothetical protein U0670_00290 [Anaerolineae bacterium]